MKQRIKNYKTALEINQKRLDHQAARINILTRALPSLLECVNNSKNPESWSRILLDEGALLIQADGASFWRYHEREHNLECEYSRGIEPLPVNSRMGLDKGELSDAVRTRFPVLIEKEQVVVAEPQSLLVVPLVLYSNVIAVFRFMRRGQTPFSSQDVDLMDMFVKQLALALENHDMMQNRDKFYLELIQTLADILDVRDASNVGQTKRARRLARAMAQELNLPEEFIYYLEFAALMHDIGKIGIHEDLLRKPGKLTTEEFEMIKKHPELGYKILSPITILAPVAPMVLYHQEWFNGKGYPEGLEGEEIPLGARIVAILDAWGAMTSHRPWRVALSKEEAIDEIVKGSGTQFDPKVVEAFLSAVEKEPVLY
ncbi:MAG: HD-GYP domain-containing protein [Elusimicrobiota bacterium]